MSIPLLVVSRNAKKLAELQRVLDTADIPGIELLSLDDVPPFAEAPETGATFADNALIKARSGVRATRLACLADDSGLAVDALNGMPGVLSARWSGGHGDDVANYELLLAQLADVPAKRRGAQFVSVCALVVPGGGADALGSGTQQVLSEGRWPGSILTAPQGENGFGYDPVFAPRGTQVSAAELTAAEKDAVSHRGAALSGLVPALRALAAGEALPGHGQHHVAESG